VTPTKSTLRTPILGKSKVEDSRSRKAASERNFPAAGIAF